MTGSLLVSIVSDHVSTKTAVTSSDQMCPTLQPCAVLVNHVPHIIYDQVPYIAHHQNFMSYIMITHAIMYNTHTHIMMYGDVKQVSVLCAILCVL
jgi:hypothetical protein